MAVTWADLTGPLVDLIGLDQDGKAGVTAAETAKQGWPATGSAVATSEFETMKGSGVATHDAIISCDGLNQDNALATIDRTWLPFGARYIRDNETTHDGVLAEWGSMARALNALFIADSETIDGSAPSAGTVTYGASNQGEGTATIAINGDSTLAELALAGIVELRCLSAGFTLQNAELWGLTWRGINPRTGREQFRSSSTASSFLKSAERFFDVAATVRPGIGISPSALNIVPQRGGAIHTGLNVLVSVPTYTPTEVSGDADLLLTAVNVNLVDGAKSNLSEKNTARQTDGTHRFYLRIVKDGSNYSFTWYADAALAVVLTDTIVLTTGSGTATQTWKAAATNPEHQTFGGHLTTSSNFISATVAAGLLTQSATVIHSALLPWATGDTITVPITNSYTGINSRFVVQELGFPLPVNNAGGETIADPS